MPRFYVQQPTKPFAKAGINEKINFAGFLFLIGVTFSEHIGTMRYILSAKPVEAKHSTH